MMRRYEVSSRVNLVKSDDAACAEPVVRAHAAMRSSHEPHSRNRRTELRSLRTSRIGIVTILLG